MPTPTASTRTSWWVRCTVRRPRRRLARRAPGRHRMVAQVESWAEKGLLYSVEDGVAWLRRNRPEKRNAMDRPLRTSLLEAIHEVSEDLAVKVAVITGNGTAFSSGA